MDDKNSCKKILRETKKLFPLKNNRLFHKYTLSINKSISKRIREVGQARVGGEYGKEIYQSLVNKYSLLPYQPEINTTGKLAEISYDLFGGIPRWRSPKLLYNVGASVNVASSSMYSIALDENVYSINEGLAGNALVAELAVANVLAKLAKLETSHYGVFTFGGTGTNLYAIKVGTRKSLPDSGKTGLKGQIKVMITEDAHFSHAVSVDWLGIGTENIEVIKPNNDRTSNLEDAESKARKILDSGYYLAAIIINGGTTYSHTIDGIGEFVRLRDKLVSEYKLSYKPPIHVDSVIGWAWLMFSNYDFKGNPLKVREHILVRIKSQYEKISEVKLADSWGVDFHKGVGACPVDCSVVIMNDYASMALLSKKEDKNLSMHQLAQEFSFFSPADYTLETSRAGGAPLAALTSLLTLGQSGYQANLANLVEGAYYLRKEAEKLDDFKVLNKESLGYVVMLILYPPQLLEDREMESKLFEDTADSVRAINAVNEYNKEFFKWDLETRMKKNIGVEYSFSSDYTKSPTGAVIPAAKLYPVSPHFNKKYAKEAIKCIKSQKDVFDSTIWHKQK